MASNQLTASVEQSHLVFSINRRRQLRLAVKVPAALMKRYVLSEPPAQSATERQNRRRNPWPTNTALNALEEEGLAIVGRPTRNGSQSILFLHDKIAAKPEKKLINTMTLAGLVVDLAAQIPKKDVPRSYLVVTNYLRRTQQDWSIYLKMQARVLAPRSEDQLVADAMDRTMTEVAEGFGLGAHNGRALFVTRFSPEQPNLAVRFNHPTLGGVLVGNRAEEGVLELGAMMPHTHPALPFIWLTGLVAMGERPALESL